MSRFALIILLFALFGMANGQSGNSVFNDSVLHEIHISIDIPDWYKISVENFANNFLNPVTYPEIYLLCSVEIDGVEIDSAGIRQKGNYSNTINTNNVKKPFKLSFNEFKGQRFDGLRKLVLNNSTDDPSFVREALLYKLIRDQGVPAPRTSFAKVTINEEYWGLYVLVESVDKSFLKDKYGATGNDGNLFKTDRGAAVSLQWSGTDTTLYKKTGISLKTNEESSDWSHLLNFINVINNTPQNEMKEKLSAVFDVESYLKVLAIEKLAYSWDSYWGGGNNFYLYEHPDGKIRWIPWDFNESFQKHKRLLNWILPDDYYLVPTDKYDERPLLKAIFSVPEWKTLYMENVCNLISADFDVHGIAPVLVDWHTLIMEACYEDQNRLDPFDDFYFSLTEDREHKIDFQKISFAFDITLPGMIPFISTRKEWAGEQMKEYGYPCDYENPAKKPYPVTLFPNPLQDVLTVQWPEDKLNIFRIIIYDMIGNVVYNSGWLYLDEYQARVDVSSLPSGFYLVKKQDADLQIGIGKLVKF